MIRRILTAALLVTAACEETTTTTPGQLNLDRPVDISFACFGGLRVTNGAPADPGQDVITTAQPLDACTIRSGARAPTDPVPVPPGQESLIAEGGAPIPGASWYGFILQSAPGTVAVAQFQTKPSSAFAGGDVLVLDADPLTPGKNGISVGEEPIAIAGDNTGCYQVVANSGSCDLSALDVTSALDPEPGISVARIQVTNAAGEVIDARPAAMVAQPPTAAIGERCPATPTGIVYVAYPSCHLVAAVDTATGAIVDGIQFDAAGVPTLLGGGNVSCPSECGGGGSITPGIRPVTLDLEHDPRSGLRRLAIGADNSPSLTIAELGDNALPLSVRQIALENTTGSLGVTQVAIAPQIGMGGTMGVINDDIAAGGQFQFVYAIATDDTVRVADILDINAECDTQIDPRLINNVTSVRELSCFPVGGTTTPGRRPGARGPGLELVGDALPTSIDIFRVPELENDTRLSGPEKLVGYFGVITATSGATFILNVDDDDAKDVENPSLPLEVSLPLAIAHQLRDALPGRDLRAETEVEGEIRPVCETNGPDPESQTGNMGGPRATGAPVRNVPGAVVAAEKVGELPYVRQVTCVGSDSTRPVSELGFTAPDLVRDLAYPDLRAVVDQTWTLTWEGSLSNDRSDADVDGPAVRVSQIFVDASGMRIVDQSAPFCDAGVEQFDVVQLRGCDPSLGDAECPLGYTCYVHPDSQVAGLGACMLVDEADRLAAACKDFLTSQRRYTIGRAASGELRLLPRASVLRTTPVDGCVDDAQCEALADYALDLASAEHPKDDTTAPNPRTYACRPDPDRAPLDGPGQTGKRCVEVCTQSSDCTTGRICREGVCMEGVVPPQACVNAPQRFELRAGDAFTVVGTQAGYVHPVILDSATGTCVRDPSAHPFEVGRIELTPPPCDPTADPRTGRRPDGSYEPNPCSLTVTHSETIPSYLPGGTCTLASPSTELMERQAPAIRFRNRGLTMTLVDPYYPGDAQCIGDRAGTLGNIPLVYPGFQLTWRQTGGFVPFTLPIGPAFPIKVVRGPTESIWVIDAGDFLSTSALQASTRGRVYRVESQTPTLVNVLE